MNDAQAHRGPDGEGVVLVGTDGLRRADRAEHLNDRTGLVALGHRRLSILDVSSAGAQPMLTEDGGVAIAFNGEIYNYIELRDELQALGVVFSSGSDTEVLLKAYGVWGCDCFSKFNGMWAVAIVDLRRRRIVLSRDRFGVKPLHYALDGDRLLVSSEIKGLLPALRGRRRLRPARAANFLRFSLVNDDDTTFFEGVESFPAGHYASFDIGATRIEPTPFWTPPPESERGRMAMEKHEAQEALRQLMSSSVALRMRSDVRVGSCLSGGLDSSTIVAFGAALRGPVDPMDTFTAGFDDRSYDERAWAHIAARAVGAREHVVVPTLDGFLEEWKDIVVAQDEPITSTSMYAQWCVMRLARERGVKVLLDGQGGDETHGGYRKFLLFRLAELVRRRKPLEAGAFFAGVLRRGDRGLLRVWEGSRYLPAALRRRTEHLERGLTAPFRRWWDEACMVREPGVAFEDRQIDDIRRLSLPALLRFEDRNSMAFGIEARLPFLDYRMVEFLLRLSPDLKIAGGQTKALMRSAFVGVTPAEILARRDKLGFSPPQSRWIKGELGERMRRRLRSDDFRLRGIIDPEPVLRRLDATSDGADAAASQAFRVYALDAWADAFDVEITA